MTALYTIFAGVFGTAFMTSLMLLIHRGGHANGDMVRALGSLATRSMSSAVSAGVAIHVASGVLFAAPYTMLLSVMVPDHGAGAAVLGGVIGLMHGIVVSFMIIAVFSDLHPIPQFRGAGFPVAIAHLVGHVGYGFGVGAAYAAFQINWGL